MPLIPENQRAVADAAQKAALGEFYKCARLMAQASGVRSEAAQRAAISNATPRVQAITKAAVSAGTLSSTGIADYQNIVVAFYESLRWLSVFDAVLPLMTPAPLRSRGTLIMTGISGGVVSEGQIKPISSLTLDSKLNEPRKVAATLVLTAELANFSSPAAVALFNSELQKGVAAATDALFLSELIANTTPIASAGNTYANVMTDFHALFDAVTLHSGSRLFYVTTPANLKGLMFVTSNQGFPALAALQAAGEALKVEVLISDQLPADTALLVDASGLAGSAENFELSASRHASVQLQTTPDSPPTAATMMLHLFQTDHRALRAERYFGFQVLRTTAVASLSGAFKPTIAPCAPKGISDSKYSARPPSRACRAQIIRRIA